MSTAVKQITLQDYKRRMLRVLVHVQKHLDEPLSLPDLAAMACFSPYHFHRVFSGMMGESVKEHVRRLRLERAAGRLKSSEVSITQIALHAGYESLEAFSRSFHAAFGLSPSRFRAERRPEKPTRSRRAAATGRSTRTACGWRYVEGQPPRNFRITRPGDMDMKVKIEHRRPMRVAFMRHVGPYDEVGGTWEKLLMFVGKEGLLGSNSCFLGICHDDPEVTPPDKIRYDACVNVEDDFQPSGEIGVQVIGGGEYAVTTHFGPYDKLGRTYRKLMGQWLPRSGRELRTAPCMEIYLNDPLSTEPEDLLTDVYAPLEPNRRL